MSPEENNALSHLNNALLQVLRIITKHGINPEITHYLQHIIWNNPLYNASFTEQRVIYAWINGNLQ